MAVMMEEAAVMAPCNFGVSDAELMAMSVEERKAVMDRLDNEFADQEAERAELGQEGEYRNGFGKYDADEWLPQVFDDGGDWTVGQDRFEHNELGW